MGGQGGQAISSPFGWNAFETYFNPSYLILQYKRLSHAGIGSQPEIPADRQGSLSIIFEKILGD